MRGESRRSVFLSCRESWCSVLNASGSDRSTSPSLQGFTFNLTLNMSVQPFNKHCLALGSWKGKRQLQSFHSLSHTCNKYVSTHFSPDLMNKIKLIIATQSLFWSAILMGSVGKIYFSHEQLLYEIVWFINVYSSLFFTETVWHLIFISNFASLSI